MSTAKEKESVDFKKRYRALKRRLWMLLYEQETFRCELTKIQRRTVGVMKDRNLMLDHLLVLRNMEVTESDTEATDESDSETGGFYHKKSMFPFVEQPHSPEMKIKVESSPSPASASTQVVRKKKSNKALGLHQDSPPKQKPKVQKSTSSSLPGTSKGNRSPKIFRHKSKKIPPRILKTTKRPAILKAGRSLLPPLSQLTQNMERSSTEQTQESIMASPASTAEIVSRSGHDYIAMPPHIQQQQQHLHEHLQEHPPQQLPGEELYTEELPHISHTVDISQRILRWNDDEGEIREETFPLISEDTPGYQESDEELVIDVP